MPHPTDGGVVESSGSGGPLDRIPSHSQILFSHGELLGGVVSMVKRWEGAGVVALTEPLARPSRPRAALSASRWASTVAASAVPSMSGRCRSGRGLNYLAGTKALRRG